MHMYVCEFVHTQIGWVCRGFEGTQEAGVYVHMYVGLYTHKLAAYGEELKALKKQVCMW